MNVERMGRVARLLRVRARLTQAALAMRAGVKRRDVSRLERGRARELRIGVVEAILADLGARMRADVLWNGPELDRLLDEGHAALAGLIKRQLERWHWLVRVEVSYSQYGERGRIDLLAFHPPTAALLVIEIKTMLVDLQQLLGSLDTKARLAPAVAKQFAWQPRTVVPAIVFAEDATTRSRIRRLDTLFDRYDTRGRRALSWLRRPDQPTTGLLWFRALPADSRPMSGHRVYQRSRVA